MIGAVTMVKYYSHLPQPYFLQHRLLHIYLYHILTHVHVVTSRSLHRYVSYALMAIIRPRSSHHHLPDRHYLLCLLSVGVYLLHTTGRVINPCHWIHSQSVCITLCLCIVYIVYDDPITGVFQTVGCPNLSRENGDVFFVS